MGAGLGLTTMALVGCGDDDDDDSASPTSSPSGGATSSPASGGSPSPSSSPAVVAGGTLKASQNRVFANFDYPMVVTDTVHQIAAVSAQSLLRFRTGSDLDPTSSEVEGWLAKDWEVADETTQIFHLADGARWQNLEPVNGRPVVADDVAVFFERILTKENNSPLWGLIGPFIDSVKAIDDQTIEFKTTAPFASLEYALASVFLAIAPREGTLGDYDMKETLIGSGPFALAESQKDALYRFEKVADYWGGTANLDDVEQLIITDPAFQLNALITGDLDFGVIQQPNLATYEASANNPVVVSYPTIGRRMIFLVPRAANAPIDDERVRRAIKLVVDQDEIIEKIFDSAGEFSGVIGPASPTWALSEEENRQLWGPNVEEARALMAEAGFEDGFDTKINFTPAHGAFMADLVQVFAAQLRQINISTEIVPRESGPHHEILFAFEHEGLVVNAQSANVGADPHDWLYKGFSVNGIYNFAQPPDAADEELQALIDRQYQIFDVDERREVAHEAERRIAELAIGIPVGNQLEHAVHHGNLHGFYPHASGQVAKYFGGVWKS